MTQRTLTLLLPALCLALPPLAAAQGRPGPQGEAPPGHPRPTTTGRSGPRLEKPGGRPSPAIVAEARRRFSRGNGLYRLGNYAEALLAYQAALDLDSEPVILYNLAQTYEKLRDPARAALFFERYLQARPKTPDRAAVLQRIENLKRAARVEVAVTSYPPGAAIYLGDRQGGVKGRTPFHLNLPLGKQRILLDLSGFVPVTRTIDVRLGETNLVDAQLQRRSSVQVDADVPGARVYIDSEPARDAHRIPHHFEVDPGKHLIHVVLDGYQRVKREVEVQQGEQLSLLVNLKALPSYGHLQVEGPRAAVVVIEGRSVTHVPMRPLRLATGTYRLSVEREGHLPWEGKATITAGRLTVVRVNLSPIRGPVMKSVLYSSIGVSAASLIAGSIFGALALRSERDYNTLPERGKLDDGKSKALLADIFFATAGATALAAIVTYFATERGKSEAEINFTGLGGPLQGAPR